MALGFREAFKAGISFGKDDMVVPETKEAIVGTTQSLAKEYEQLYRVTGHWTPYPSALLAHQ